ncbi:Asparagine synthetase [glutamine-hydrolyzing] 1 [Planctomycetes bacterium K23_9]|uniref:asparagine synthase (glutamine-hydrolyzing) n=2 Tax=Stieleria marina TaxID=1930275 RepID=A0A517NYS6_9BACT|nr:Asparagine synthetase [glutamine-hydrolyzing] 1 [Planctomycetes bacterium K23_9]
MHSNGGRFTITFNGEIYNFREIRSALESLGHGFKSDCDTEVILAAVEQWGLTEAVERLHGMFAFGLYDQRLQTLQLVRDRVGIKPLYYGWNDEGFMFASELHAMRTIQNWQPTINRDALCMFMRYGYVPTPYSIYENVYKLIPGSVLTLTKDELRSPAGGFSPFATDSSSSPSKYWSVEDVYESGGSNLFQGTLADAVAECENVLSDAIEARMVADVPLGAFLSGGIDSSTIVTLMQEKSSRPVKTFTIGIKDHAYDESSDAKKLADFLGTDHTEHFVSASDALDVVPNLQQYYDEPFADSSQIPTYLLSKITREHVTVALSGDGGDEVFGGYNRYIHAPKILDRLNWVPNLMRQGLAGALLHGPWSLYGAGLKLLSPVLPESMNDRWLEITIPKFADLLSSRSQREFYDRVTLLWPTDALVLNGHRTQTRLTDVDGLKFAAGSSEMRCRDLLSYHPDDILTKVDRASMAVSLEARVPFVDHKVLEFATRLPESFLTGNGKGKVVLRELLKSKLPDSFTFGKNKRGFSIPLADWLRGPLKEWAAALLDRQKIESQGFLNADLVQRTWDEHQSGTKEYAYRLWNVLMFQAFLEAHHS